MASQTTSVLVLLASNWHSVSHKYVKPPKLLKCL
jgi:hypothetical protein